MKELKHFLKFGDFNQNELQYLFNLTQNIKQKYKAFEQRTTLQDRTLVMIFEKSSTRTRLSFELGMNQLGGSAVYLNTKDSQLGRGEPVADSARVISRMCDLVMIRTFEQELIQNFAQHSTIPVINGLTEQQHPCQVLADIFTFIEKNGSIRGATVAWIGDANNMCNSWMEAAETLDFQLHISSPPGYGPKDLSHLKHVKFFPDPQAAVHHADLVTTDVWASMGFEEETKLRKQDFQGWQVNSSLMALASKDALFMHCLPAHRGEEVSAEVIDGDQSVVWDEAENRLHVQKALMEFLLLGIVVN
ncbi:MAG TPA: ornithine carbamoyltransferase [Betaproteobacteria bacterium]|jgi:ornithine carbamoyltransferase|nr:ornithine carbamoyltransferase [Betaproteobacteria bacterium]